MNVEYYAYNYTEILTPAEVYPARVLSAGSPAGYSITDFRPPKLGETFLADGGGCYTATCNYKKNSPRFILKKLPEIVLGCEETSISVKEVYGGDVKIPEGWKYESFRIPKDGETYISTSDTVYTAGHGFTSPRIIVKKVS